jgi:1-acyl-sn-glycerol-3-phosphate acyltransferase
VFVRLVAATLRARFAFSLSGELPALGCVVVSHHDSYWDGVVAAALDPRVAPITSGNWRSIPVVGPVLRSYGVLWTDDQTVASATALVRRGAACWIAPRGFDRARENPAHLGAARICVAAGAPLVPMSLSGLARPARRPRSPAAIAIWPPVMPGPGESAEAFAERLEGLLPRSVY